MIRRRAAGGARAALYPTSAVGDSGGLARLERLHARHGDVFALRKVGSLGPLVAVAHPDLATEVFAGPPWLFHGGEGNASLAPMVGERSLLVADGREHADGRRVILPLLRSERVRAYGPLIERITRRVLDECPIETPVAIYPALRTITLRTMSTIVTGTTEPAALCEFETAVLGLVGTAPAVIGSPAWWRRSAGLADARRFRRARQRLDALVIEEIERRRRAPRDTPDFDVLSNLMRECDHSGKPFGDRYVRDQVVTLLTAGYHTTSASLAWAIERMARDRTVVERLRTELVAGTERYLQSVIRETLRSRPVIPWALRRVTAPASVGGKRVTSGTGVGVSIYLIHHHPDFYPDPASYRPERFETNPPSPSAWIPFGGGTRRCPGAALALYAMNVVLRTILERYEPSAPDPRPEPATGSGVLAPAYGARVILTEVGRV